jgi:hypothetical protein
VEWIEPHKKAYQTHMLRTQLLGQGQQDSPSISPGDWSWRFWLAVPLYPYSRRRTLRKEVVKDTIWTFDQLQGILYTVVPIRMTVVKLEKGVSSSMRQLHRQKSVSGWLRSWRRSTVA